MYSIISAGLQRSRRHRASIVLVDTDSPAFSLRTVELLMLPLTCRVYVVASRFSGVRNHVVSSFLSCIISIIAYNEDKAL